MQIIDSFPFFAPTGRELLKLRVNLYKDIVDKFVIVESNKTHSGKPVPFRFEEIANELKLPMDKIIYIPQHINDSEWLEPLEVDIKNAGVNASNPDSVRARIRERLQKDGVLQALHMFNDDDVFIYGDADEIINPIHIKWVANTINQAAKNNIVVKIPLVFLQGRADLRVWDISRGEKGAWFPWDRSTFFATKAQLSKSSVSNIRCGNVNYKTMWPRSHGKGIPEMGWHFAWMGNKNTRKAKATSFAHAHDNFKEMGYEGGFQDKGYQTWLEEMTPTAGKPALNGNTNQFLKKYPMENLPDLLLEDEELYEFFLPYNPEII
jgi:hypothetical protein